MFITNLTVVALAGFLAAAPAMNRPEWATSYSSALAMSSKLNKPIAVFIAPTASATWAQEGNLPSETVATLRKEFIALKVDSSSTDGKRLAAQFGLQEGLVISNKSGELIALRHEGAVAKAELGTYLNKHNGTAAVTTTEYHSTVVNVQPTQYIQPVQYAQPRPILNAVQNVGQTMGNAVQRTGQFLISPLSGGS